MILKETCSLLFIYFKRLHKNRYITPKYYKMLPVSVCRIAHTCSSTMPSPVLAVDQFLVLEVSPKQPLFLCLHLPEARPVGLEV